MFLHHLLSFRELDVCIYSRPKSLFFKGHAIYSRRYLACNSCICEPIPVLDVFSNPPPLISLFCSVSTYLYLKQYKALINTSKTKTYIGWRFRAVPFPQRSRPGLEAVVSLLDCRL